MEQAPKRKGSRRLILDFFLANIGRVIEGEELRLVSGNVSEWGRRVRELRDDDKSKGGQDIPNNVRVHCIGWLPSGIVLLPPVTGF